MNENNSFQKVLNTIIISFFSLMVVSTILQVLFRYFLKHPLGWTEELAKILFIWSAFLSLSILSKRNILIKVEFILDFFPKYKEWIFFVIEIISGLSLLWLAFLGIKLLGLGKTQLSPCLNIPYWLIYLSLPIGLILSGYYTLFNLFKRIKSIIKKEIN
jgi:TRAP-type C4-dicarboxylate transport system permease small subunit